MCYNGNNKIKIVILFIFRKNNEFYKNYLSSDYNLQFGYMK